MIEIKGHHFKITDDPEPVSPASLPSPAPDNPLEALEWLGGTVEEVAEGLRARGIKGQPRIANACPLAHYLGTWWGNPSIYTQISIIDDEKQYYCTEWTPTVCRSFIKAFDEGEFPDLEA